MHANDQGKGDSLSAETEQLRRSMLDGSRWTAIGQGATQAVRFLAVLFLARLLGAAEFGIMGMALVAIGFVDLFRGLGTGPAIIRAESVSGRFLSSVFVFNLVVGMAISGLVFAGAPLVAGLYRQPVLTDIIRVLSLTVFVSSLAVVKQSLFLRELRFGQLALIDFLSAALQGVLAILLAYGGAGVWALVYSYVIGIVISTVLLLICGPKSPIFGFSWSEVKKIVGFSASITGSQLFGYLITQVDRLVIGVFLGEVALGLYGMAKRILETGLNVVTVQVNKVALPVFSKLQRDNQQFAILFRRMCGTIAVLTLPGVVGLALCADLFAEVILGPKWDQLPNLMVILAIPTLVQCLAFTVAVVYVAKNKAHWLLAWQMAAGILTLLAYFAGLPWGVQGVAWAYALVIVLLVYPAFAIPLRLIDLSVLLLFRSLLPYFGITLIMGVLAWTVRESLAYVGASEVVTLVGTVLAGVLSYVGTVLWFRPVALADVRAMLLGGKLASAPQR